MSGLISVLMPVLNEEATLVDAVGSVLNQAEEVEVEVLVIDGNSVDQTLALARSLSRRDPRVRVLRNPRTTISSGLNVGLRHARGDFVARVDGHSTISPTYLSRAVRALHEDPRMAGIGGKRVGVSDNPVGRAVALALSSRFGVGNSINHYATSARLTDHASFGVYRSEVAVALGGWDESLLVNEDVDFDLRLLRLGHRIGFDPVMELRWQVRDDVGQLFRQYRRYGRGKAAMVRKNGRSAVRVRHAIPPAAVLIGAGALLGALQRPRWLASFVPYLAAVAAASAVAWRSRQAECETSAAALPLAFVAMHTGWGLGFLEGMILRQLPALASGDPAHVPSREES